MLVYQMPAQAGLLGESFVTEDAEKLGEHATFVSAMTRQAPRGFVPVIANITLKFAGDVAGFFFTASRCRFAMAIQRV